MAVVETYTLRQIRLVFQQLQRRQSRERAETIENVNHGLAGGEETRKLVRSLREQ